MYYSINPGKWLKKLILFFFTPMIQKIGFDGEKLKEYMKDKPSIFVFYSYSFFDYVALSYHLQRVGLPEPVLFCPPFPRLISFFRRLFRKEPPDIAGAMRKALEEKRPIVLYLRYYVDNVGLMKILFAEQKSMGEDFQIIPTVLLWKKKPLSARKRLIDVILGPSEFPGKLRKIMLIVRNYKRAFFHFGKPVNLREYIEENKNLPEDVQIRKLRLVLRYHLARELHTILGPPRLPRKYIIKSIANDPMVVDALKELASATGEDWKNLQKKLERYLREIASNISQTYIQLLDIVLTWLFNTIYEGIDYNKDQMEAIRDAARRGSLVLVPCHRSHLDYLIMSYVFYYENLSLPYIAAGINLSFFPLGPIFRGAGAFFIRRSFRDNKVYALALHHYLKYLLDSGSNVEFFIEGTRSRNGKLLPPRLGMVKMIVKGFLEGLKKDVSFLPIGITYEVVVEEKSYLKELEGGEKQKENVKGLLKATSVLKNRYGMVYIRFRPLIDLGEFLEKRDLKPGGNYEDSRIAAVVEELGYTIINEIGKAITMTPSSLLAIAILMNPAKGVDEDTLRYNSQLIMSLTEPLNINLTRSLKDVDYAIRRALKRFKKEDLLEEVKVGGEKIIIVKDDKRIAVDYYKNNVIHFFVMPSFAALSWIMKGEEGREVFDTLVRVFSYEFNLKYVDEDYVSYERWVAFLKENGILEDRRKLFLVGELVKNFIESYIILYQTILNFGVGEHRESKVLQETLKVGKVLFLKGQLWRPESFSKVNFSNALHSLVEGDIIVRKKGRGIRKRGLIEVGESELREIENLMNFLSTVLEETGKEKM